MKNFFKHISRSLRVYFDISLRQARGTLALMIVVFVIFAINIVTPLIFNDDISAKDDSQKSDSILALIQAIADTTGEYRSNDVKFKNTAHTNTIAQRFDFDPNTVSEENLRKLGIQKYVANGIINYRNKGGIFRTKKDFKRMYGLDSNQYISLMPYILLPDTLAKKIYISFPKTFQPAKQPITIEINTADSALFETIYGIGPKMASRIVKYREKLGGYYAMNQLKDIWGVDSILYQELMKKCVINMPAKIQKIVINIADEKTLKEHPYFRNYSKHIIAYRNTHGGFKSLDDLAKIKTIPPDKLVLMAYYLSFE
ncbi:MAG: helix-hairpin-helix domain-containing protein [Cytophagales bacterium]|nr:helix-hairpin-helix domain-containing protein [Cytophagales bacterium]